jgi:tetratricopeptide (TPR) repeat protein
VDSLYHVFDVRGSLAAAETLAAADPRGVAAWRAGRAAVALGMLAQEENEQNGWYRTGEAHAARALAADSLSMDALFWLTAAKGRRALNAGARDAARLGDEVWELAHRMLARDPDYPGAHNVLGTLQYEVMTLSRLERFLAKLILGDNEALDGSTWDGAEAEHRRAVALAPEAILYRYDLGRTLLRRGRTEEAIVELRRVLSLPHHYPHDPGIQGDARRVLRRLGEAP